MAVSYYVKPEMERYGICVVRRPDESPEMLLKRFKKKFSKSGIIQEYKNRMSYEKPSARKRKKRRDVERKRIKELNKELKRERM